MQNEKLKFLLLVLPDLREFISSASVSSGYKARPCVKETWRKAEHF